MGENDVRFAIPEVYLYRNHSREAKVKIGGPIQGRPVVVLKQLIDLGVSAKVYDASLIEKIIVFGFDRGYWTDSPVLSTPWKYWVQDMNFRKSQQERLKELDNDDRCEVP